MIASCSVQKRRYTKGWHIDWSGSHVKNGNKNADDQKPLKAHPTRPAQPVTTEAVSTFTFTQKANPPMSTGLTAEHSKTYTSAKAASFHSGQLKLKRRAPATMAVKFKPITNLHKIKGGGRDNTDLFALLSLVFAIVGTGILGIIFGVIALKGYKAEKGNTDQKIFARVGIIISIVKLSLALLVLTLFIILLP